MSLSDQTFWQHADELRKTILKSLFILAIGVIVALFFYREIFTLLQAPLSTPFTQKKISREQIINESQKTLSYTLPNDATIVQQSSKIKIEGNKVDIPPQGILTIDRAEPGSKLLIFSPIDGILITFKVCFFIGLAATSPIILYYLLNFIAPALEQRFYRLLMPFIALSVLFMSLGAGFAFFITIPIANQYLTLFNQEIGTNFWSLSNYLDYTILLLIGNAISFEICVIALFLVQMQVLSYRQLQKSRRYFILFAFILSAILTPPDIFTQVMLATPLIIIYELIILYAYVKYFRIVKVSAH